MDDISSVVDAIAKPGGLMPHMMEFECRACGKMFGRAWLHLTRSLERVHYNATPRIPDVEISGAEGLAEFCSRSCKAVGVRDVMAEQQVPIPATRPNIGPIETCAKCSRPVDMSAWHVTFTDGMLEERPFGVAVMEIGYVAVVCRKCSAELGQEQEGSREDAQHPVTAVG